MEEKSYIYIEARSRSVSPEAPAQDDYLKQFIMTYKSLPSLWDRTNQNYLNKRKRNEDLDKLARILRYLKTGATRDDARKKVNSLRSNFRKELTKIENSKKSGGDEYKPTSATFHMLKFLANMENPLLIEVQAHELGRDYEHCWALARKLDDLDSDMKVDEQRVKSTSALADRLLRQGPTQQAAAVAPRRDALLAKWRALSGNLQKYRDALSAALEIHAFNRDVEDTAERIAKKAALFASSERGRDLDAAQELKRRHVARAAEAGAVRDKIKQLCKEGDKLQTQHPEHAEEIEGRLSSLRADWERLQQLAAQRTALLDDAIAEHKFDDSLKGCIMEENGSVPAAVFIKQEPEDGSDDEASHKHEAQRFMLLREQIKVEIEFEGVEPVCVKQEPSCEDSRAGSEAEAGQDAPESGHLQPAEAPSQAVIVEVAPATQHAQDCPDGATGSTDTRDTETKPYTCDKCGKQFKEIYFYISHMQLHEHNMEIVEESVTKQTKFPCDICDKVYTSKSGLYQHQQKHYCARYSCRYCDKQFTMHCYLKKHERIHTKPYSCDICKKQFADSTALMTHKRIHTGEKPFGCEICEKKFAHLSDLAKHKRIHTGEKPYACEVCKKQFRCASHLVTHRKVHSDDKPHSCDTCKKQFADVASLTVHKRVHTGEKPFSCEVCNKKFTRNSSLITHRQQHTRGGFSCDICKKQFTQSGNLRKHNKVQHPEVCT